MDHAEMEAAIRCTAKALIPLLNATAESAERDFAMKAEIEAVRVLTQALVATFRSEPAFASQFKINLQSTIEADRIVSLNSAIADEFLLARELWIKALVPAEMHLDVFPAPVNNISLHLSKR